jgi:chromosome partitioning protein
MSQGLDRVIAIVNGKGGVGKTTIAANIGGMLAASGYRVLLVDMDPQGNLAEELGYTDADTNDDGMALAQTLVFGSEAQPALGIRENLDVLMGGSHLDMAAAGLTLKAQKDPAIAKAALAQGLEGLAENYDLIFIDCPPGQETLQQAALAAARWALIPVKTDASSRKGLRDVARRLDAVVAINPDLDLLGIVLFGVNRSAKRVSESAREAIRQDLGSGAPIFATSIRHAEAAAQESRERGLLAFELEEAVLAAPKWWELRRGSGQQHDGPRSKSAVGVAEDFQALGEEVVARITESESTSIPTSAAGAES